MAGARLQVLPRGLRRDPACRVESVQSVSQSVSQYGGTDACTRILDRSNGGIQFQIDMDVIQQSSHDNNHNKGHAPPICRPCG